MAEDSEEKSSSAVLPTLFGESAFRRRRKAVSLGGIWFAVMFVRNMGQQSRITCTSHIGSLRVSRPALEGQQQQQRPPASGDGVWKIALALGPMRDEMDANSVCRLWSLCQKGMLVKAARGEAICIRFGIPGFVDWESVFGPLALGYRLQFFKNPCAELAGDAASSSPSSPKKAPPARKRRRPKESDEDGTHSVKHKKKE